MVNEIIFTMGKSLGAALAAVLAGFSAVAVFNGMPPKWLTDYGDEPTPDIMDRSRPRVRKRPWAYILSIALCLVFIKIIMIDYRFFACGALMMWTLAVMALADAKYKIIPDQMIIACAVCGIGFIPFVDSWKDQLGGLLIGGGVMFVIALISKFASREAAIGGGDIKLFAAIGICLGVRGVVAVLMMTVIFMAAHAVFRLGAKKIKLGDSMAMVPYIFVSTGLYLSFIWEMQLMLEI
ncbi:MAG: A24 family peptidase [Clostridiales bacterium]|nr:A24 family peptidase [Clostridiales bacterium]